MLTTKFYAAFRRENQFRDAIEEITTILAKYSRKQSKVTAGINEGYDCPHDGVKYSLQKHIGVGASSDQCHCFRLYFERDLKSASPALFCRD